MADNHYELDEATSKKGRDLMATVRTMTSKWYDLIAHFKIMVQMLDGDGSSSTHFQKMVDEYGVEGTDANDKLANAKAIYDELNSTQGNSGALTQFLAKLG